MTMINHLTLLYKISQLKEKLYIDLLRKLEINKDLMPVHINILLVIDNLKENPIIVNVAKELCKSKADTSAVVSTLAKKGYITYTTSPSDGRAKLLALTEQGKIVIEKTSLIKDELDTILLNALNDNEKENFFSFLSTTGKNLEDALSKKDSIT